MLFECLGLRWPGDMTSHGTLSQGGTPAFWSLLDVFSRWEKAQGSSQPISVGARAQ